MKLIIAGGRHFVGSAQDGSYLMGIHDALTITEIVSGGASGADKYGEEWGAHWGIPVKIFPADWNAHGRAAGPIRNKQMAEYADAVVLFPGGDGTDSMADEALAAGIRIFDRR